MKGKENIKKRKYKKYHKYENKKFRYKNKYFRPRRKKWYKREKGKNYYKEKEKKTMNNEKYCPQGKKNCKCWLCHEIGHYANECPNKKSYKKEVKYLNQISAIGLVPIESLNSSGNESSYCYEILSSSESENGYSSSDESE